MKRAAAIVLAMVLAWGAGTFAGTVLDPSPAHADTGTVPSVHSATLADAFGACYHAYAVSSPALYFDCVNAAYLHFDGRGHHSRYYNV